MTLPSVEGGFGCVCADPPWTFTDKGSRAVTPYDTMTVEQVCALPVSERAAADSLLFLWTTSAHLLDGSAVKVCNAWGFTPKTTMAWVKRGTSGKLQVGFGHYTRAAHELVVIARRGKAHVLRRNVPSVFEAPRSTHSTKPELFQDIVETLASGPYLELFARRQRAGWSTWGNDPAVADVTVCCKRPVPCCDCPDGVTDLAQTDRTRPWSLWRAAVNAQTAALACPNCTFLTVEDGWCRTCGLEMTP